MLEPANIITKRRALRPLAIRYEAAHTLFETVSDNSDDRKHDIGTWKCRLRPFTISNAAARLGMLDHRGTPMHTVHSLPRLQISGRTSLMGLTGGEHRCSCQQSASLDRRIPTHLQDTVQKQHVGRRSFSVCPPRRWATSLHIRFYQHIRIRHAEVDAGHADTTTRGTRGLAVQSPKPPAMRRPTRTVPLGNLHLQTCPRRNATPQMIVATVMDCRPR